MAIDEYHVAQCFPTPALSVSSGVPDHGTSARQGTMVRVSFCKSLLEFSFLLIPPKGAGGRGAGEILGYLIIFCIQL